METIIGNVGEISAIDCNLGKEGAIEKIRNCKYAKKHEILC